MAKYGINKAILVGNLGKDPEVRYLDQGVAVANFSIATTESYRTRDGQQNDRTQWHNIVMWRGLAETAGKYLKKGSTVYLEGKIINRSWDDANGEKKYRTEIEVDKMVMLDSRGAGLNEGGFGNQGGGQQFGNSNTAKPAAEKPASIDTRVSEEEADDLPF